MKQFRLFSVFAAVLAVLALCACGSAPRERPGEGGRWTFENPDLDVGGWRLVNAEFYQYSGPAALSRDTVTLGKPLLRLDLDYSKDVERDWSEVKIANDFPKSINMKDIRKFTFDFYYNPSLRTGGTFRPKIWSNNGSRFIDETGIYLDGGEEVGDGWYKVSAMIVIAPAPGFIPDMRLGIVGSLTDYAGPIFLDNIAWEE